MVVRGVSGVAGGRFVGAHTHFGLRNDDTRARPTGTEDVRVIITSSTSHHQY